MSNFYKLNKDKSVSLCSAEEWSDQYEEMSRTKTKHVAKDLIDNKRISTVWLGLNNNFWDGAPLVFETMVFNSEDSRYEIYCDRYSTWKEAEEGHQKAIEWVKNGCKKDDD